MSAEVNVARGRATVRRDQQRQWRNRIVLALIIIGTGLRPALALACVGDCNGDGMVAINELVTGVNIALGVVAVSTCRAMDADGDGNVSINELIAAVNNALNGCAAAPTPTGAPTVTLQTARNTPTPADTVTSPPTNTPPPTATATTTERGMLHPVLQDLPAAVLSVCGTTPNDVYAVGADSNDGRGPYVIHYDGSTWKRLDTGVLTGGLWWISVTLIDGDFYMAGDNGVILQFDPSSGRFTRQATPDTSQLFGVWGTAADNLWAVGTAQFVAVVLWHFDGKTWMAQDVSDVVPRGTTSLYKVWGRSAADVFAVGTNGVVLHFDGKSWSLLESGVSSSLFTVHGSDSVLAAVGGTSDTGVILEQQSDGSFVDHAPSGTPEMNGVFVPPNGNAVAVGFGLSVATRDSSGWTLVPNGSDLRDFHGTWVDASDGIWAVGGDLSNLNNGILSYGGPQSVAPGPVQ